MTEKISQNWASAKQPRGRRPGEGSEGAEAAEVAEPPKAKPEGQAIRQEQLQAKMGKLDLLRLLGGILLGFLLGRATVFGPLSPFGIAYFGAARRSGLDFLPLAIAVGLGHWSVAGGNRGMAALLIALALLEGAVRGLERFQFPPFTTGLAAGAAILVGRGAEELFLGHSFLATFVPAGFEALLAGFLTVVFTQGLGGLFRGRSQQTEGAMAGAALLAMAIGGLGGLKIWGVSLAAVAANLLVLAYAAAGGGGLGAAAGAAMGLLGLITGVTDPFAMGVYALGGLVAGLFKELGRVGMVLAYSFIYLILSYRMQGLEALLQQGATAAAAAALVLVLPGRWLSLLAALPLARPAAAKEAVDDGRVSILARLFRQLQLALAEQAATAEPELKDDEGVGLPLVVKDQVQARVCDGCSLYRTCWLLNAERTEAAMGEVWHLVRSEGPLSARHVPDELSRRCIHPGDVVVALNYLNEQQAERQKWAEQLIEMREFARGAFRSVAGLLEQMPVEGAYPTLPAKFQLRVGLARLPKRGSLISGDAYVTAPLPAGRHLLGLSDGMGAGHGAAERSGHALALFHELLGAGFSVPTAIETINTILLLKSTSEAFATLDAALFDLATGTVDFVKVGAAPSFVKRGREVKLVKNGSPPVGILNEVEPEVDRHRLMAGDFVVLLTDGLWELGRNDVDREGWLIAYLEKVAGAEPEALAEGLVAKGLDSGRLAADDDITVLVALVEAAPQGKPGLEEPW